MFTDVHLEYTRSRMRESAPREWMARPAQRIALDARQSARAERPFAEEARPTLLERLAFRRRRPKGASTPAHADTAGAVS